MNMFKYSERERNKICLGRICGCVEEAKEAGKDDPEEKHDDKANDDAAITYEDIAHECPNLKLSTLLVAEKAFIETDVDHSGEIDVQGM